MLDAWYTVDQHRLRDEFMRSLMRLLATIALALAVIAGVVDTIQSFAASNIVMTPASAVWQAASGLDLEATVAWVMASPMGEHAANAVSWILSQPAFAVFLALALLFWIVGYKKPRAAGRFAA